MSYSVGDRFVFNYITTSPKVVLAVAEGRVYYSAPGDPGDWGSATPDELGTLAVVAGTPAPPETVEKMLAVLAVEHGNTLDELIAAGAQ